MPPSATAARTAPPTSKCSGASGSRVSGTQRCAITTVSAARGRLIRKIQRQEAYCTRAPPTNGPIAAATLAEPRPRADGTGPALGLERTLDHGQAAGRQHRGADALQDAGQDQHGGAGGDPAQQRREREPDRADDEDAPAAVPVAERAAQQDQRRHGQQVAVADPLQLGQVRVEVATDGAQGDVDDRAVEQRQPRAEDGGRHDRAPGRAAVRDLAARGAHGWPTSRASRLFPRGRFTGSTVSPWPSCTTPRSRPASVT